MKLKNETLRAFYARTMNTIMCALLLFVAMQEKEVRCNVL